MKLELARDIYIPDYEAEKGMFLIFLLFFVAKCISFITEFVDRSLNDE